MLFTRDVLPPTATEGSLLPECLGPDLSDRMFPSLDVKDLSQLKEGGWARVGIVAAILDERQRILMLTHKQSDKTPAGALGPLAETSQLTRGSRDEIEVETIAHTLARGMREELGVRNPSGLGLTAKRLGAWVTRAWPVGVQYAQQNALAVCPVVHLGRDAREALQDTFAETEEISGITFMSPEDIAAQKLVRPGTQDWLTAVVMSGLIDTRPDESARVNLPSPAPLAGAVDVKFNQLGYL